MAWTPKRALLGHSSDQAECDEGVVCKSAYHTFLLANKTAIKIEPKYYEDIHNYWSELQGVEITKVDTILDQVIWNNWFITIKKNAL